eukprot:2309066-Pyramimonas_sp.AAC.1
MRRRDASDSIGAGVGDTGGVSKSRFGGGSASLALFGTSSPATADAAASPGDTSGGAGLGAATGDR